MVLDTSLFTGDVLSPTNPGLWDECSVNVTYMHVSGNVQLPNTAGTLSTVLKIAQPTALKVIDWQVVKKGVKPPVPSPISTDPNLTLAYAEITVPQRLIGADGVSVRYIYKGTYVYLMTQSFVPGIDNLPGATVPTDLATPVQTQLDSSLFQTGMF